MADQAWFEEQALAQLSQLYGTALRLAKNPHDAEDLVAETLCKAWSRRHSLKDPERIRPWLHRILMNTFLSAKRHESSCGTEPSPEPQAPDEPFSLFERFHQPFLLWWSNPEKEFLNKLLREDLEKAVDALPEAFRVVVVLCDLEGLSYQEIAAALRVPIGTVRSRLARGRSLLQKALWDHAESVGLLQRPAVVKREST